MLGPGIIHARWFAVSGMTTGQDVRQQAFSACVESSKGACTVPSCCRGVDQHICVPEQNGNSFATLSMPARSAVSHHGEALPRQASASYPDRDRDPRTLQPLQAPGTDRLSPLMSSPPVFSPDVRRHPDLIPIVILTLPLTLASALALP